MTAIWGGLTAIVMLLWFARDLPRPEDALDASRRPSLALHDRAGHVFASFGDIVGDQLRCPTCPPTCPRPRVAIEDRRFWHHPGIDLVGLARAAWTNLIGRARGAGRLDDHAAGRQDAVPDQCPDAAPQGAGTASDPVAGAHVSPSAKSSKSG